MDAYSFNKQGIYTGPVPRQWSIEEQRWLLPAGAAEPEPIQEDGKVSVWNGTVWENKTDNSGVWYKTKNKQQVILNPLDSIEGLTKIKPEDFVIWNGSNWIEDTETLNKIESSKIKQQLYEIDIKKVRPLTELNDPSILDKTFAQNKLFDLEAESSVLRLELKKYE